MRNIRQSRLETGRRRLQRRGSQIFGDGIKAFFLIASILLVSLLLIYTYSYAMSAAYFSIRETQVRGCKELTEKDVLLLAAVKPGQNLLAVNVDALRNRIRKNPWVRDVYVGREFPERLVIEVRERTPVALLKKEDGFYLMDAEGLVFKRLENGDDSDLPALTGCYREGRLNRRLLASFLDLFRYLSTSKAFISVKSIAEIHGDEVLGFSVFNDSGLCLRLGFDHYDNKIKRLMPVLADLEKRNIPLRYLLIDLTDPTKITVQKRQVLTPAAPGAGAKGYRT